LGSEDLLACFLLDLGVLLGSEEEDLTQEWVTCIPDHHLKDLVLRHPVCEEDLFPPGSPTLTTGLQWKITVVTTITMDHHGKGFRGILAVVDRTTFVAADSLVIRSELF